VELKKAPLVHEAKSRTGAVLQRVVGRGNVERSTLRQPSQQVFRFRALFIGIQRRSCFFILANLMAGQLGWCLLSGTRLPSSRRLLKENVARSNPDKSEQNHFQRQANRLSTAVDSGLKSRVHTTLIPTRFCSEFPRVSAAYDGPTLSGPTLLNSQPVTRMIS